MSDAVSQLRGRIWLSSAIPDQNADIPDPRVIATAARGRTAVVHVAMATFARDLQLIVHADPRIVPVLLHVALGYRPFVGAPRVLVVANASDQGGIDLATRWGPKAGAVETVPDATTVDDARNERIDHGLAQPNVQGAFFVGGSPNDISHDGREALTRNIPCFALPGTGRGADDLFYARGVAMCGNDRHLQSLLRDELSLPVAINACFDVIESSRSRTP